MHGMTEFPPPEPSEPHEPSPDPDFVRPWPPEGSPTQPQSPDEQAPTISRYMLDQILHRDSGAEALPPLYHLQQPHPQGEAPTAPIHHTPEPPKVVHSDVPEIPDSFDLPMEVYDAHPELIGGMQHSMENLSRQHMQAAYLILGGTCVGVVLGVVEGFWASGRTAAGGIVGGSAATLVGGRVVWGGLKTWWRHR